MQTMFEQVYEAIIETESALLLHLHVNPFELGDLPILDFMVYRTKLCTMIEDTADNVGSYK